jgi:hypothetical protein
MDSTAPHGSLVNRIDNVDIINIETSDRAVISDASSVQQVIERNSRYFILDDKYMSVKVFDSTGKYLYNVGGLGIGRGEFVRVEEIAYYPPHHSLLVLCNRPTKMCEFTLDGRLIHETNMSFWATSFAVPSENTRLFYINQNKSELSEDQNILLTDSAYAIRSRMFDMPKKISSTLKFSGGLYLEGDGTYFNPALSGTYYLMSNDTAKPVYKIDYGARNVPAGLSELKLMPLLRKCEYQFGTFTKDDDYLGFNYFDRGVNAAFYNLHSRQVLTSDTRLDSLNLLFANTFFEADGEYIMVLDIKRMSGFIKRNYAIITRRFPAFAHLSLDREHPNPALVTFKLKSM